jgi:hypothetical protein
MKPILITGITIVNLALLSYSLAFLNLNRRKQITKLVMISLISGVLFDIISTICMIIGSGRILTLHGIIGYTALAGMLTDAVLIYRVVRSAGYNEVISAKLIRFSRVTYFYWIAAYVTGIFLIAL